MEKSLLPLFVFAAAALATARVAPRAALSRPALVAVLTAGITIWGFLALRRLPVELMPNSASDVVTVTVGVRGGMASGDVEALIVRPLEDALGELPRLRTMFGSAKRDRGVVTLEFQPGVDMKRVTAEAHERVDRALSRLPVEIEKPVIAHFEDNDTPVYILAFTSRQFSPEALRKTIEDGLKDRLLQVPGVATVELGGGREEKVLVELDRDRMAAYGVSPHRVARLLARRNIATQVGSVEGSLRETPVRVTGALRDSGDIRRVVVGRGASGGPLVLEQIATVAEDFLEPESISRLNGESAVSLYILKESSANTLEVVRGVRRALADAWRNFPAPVREQVHQVIVSNQADGILAAMASVRVSLLCGILLILLALCLFESEGRPTRRWAAFALAVVTVLMATAALLSVPDPAMEWLYGAVLLGFLALAWWEPDVRAGLIIAGSMPLSALVSFILFGFCGITLNAMSLFGLALGLGMLVDNATVVFERVLTEEKAKGRALTFPETIEVTDEMVVPLIGATVTNAIVFVPFFFLSKDIQALYTDVAAAVGASLFASLTISLTVVPLLACAVTRKSRGALPDWPVAWSALARRGRERLRTVAQAASRLIPQGDSWKVPPVEAVALFLALFAGFWFTGWLSAARWLYAAAGAGSAVFGLLLLKKGASSGAIMKKRAAYLGAAFLLAASGAAVLVWGTDRDFDSSGELDEFVVFVELTSGIQLPVSDAVVRDVEKRIQADPVAGPAVRTLVSRVEGWSSKVYVTLKPRARRGISADAVQDRLRRVLADAGKDRDPNAFVHFSSPRTGHEMSLSVFGPDYSVLEDLAQKITGALGKISGLTDVKMRYRPGRPEIRALLAPERSAAMGLSAEAVAETAHALWRGLRATVLRRGAGQIETIVRLHAKDRDSIESLGDLPLQLPRGGMTRLAEVAHLEMAQMPNEIFRENKERLIEITANRSGVSLGRAARESLSALDQVEFPLDYHAELGRDVEDMERAIGQLTAGVAVMVILVYLVLVVLFESIVEPLVIMTTVPLCLVGVATGLVLFGLPVGTGVLVGIIMLAGVVVNNAIMLLDHFNGHTNHGVATAERLRQAVEARTRPILLTAASAILGFLPMMLDGSESGALWRPLAVTMVFGLLTSTVFTLFVTPCLTQVLVQDLPDKLRHLFHSPRVPNTL